MQAEAEADRIITASLKVCDTGREGQAETPGGFQDPKHEVKDGPLGRTALLRPGTRAHTHTIQIRTLHKVSTHVMRA